MNSFEKSLTEYYSSDILSKIQEIRIGIAGAGGLGSNITHCLIRSGFKNFEILDSDNIETKNLNRQFYFLDEVGKAKVDVLKKRLLKINPDCSIIIHTNKLTKENCSQYFQNTDILFEAFDNIESKN